MLSTPSCWVRQVGCWLYLFKPLSHSWFFTYFFLLKLFLEKYSYPSIESAFPLWVRGNLRISISTPFELIILLSSGSLCWSLSQLFHILLVSSPAATVTLHCFLSSVYKLSGCHCSLLVLHFMIYFARWSSQSFSGFLIKIYSIIIPSFGPNLKMWN